MRALFLQSAVLKKISDLPAEVGYKWTLTGYAYHERKIVNITAINVKSFPQGSHSLV